MTIRFRTDDPEMAPPTNDTAGLPMFDAPWWPEAPKVKAESLCLPIPGTIDGDYKAWRESPEGEQAFACLAQRALELATTGQRRVSTKALFEWYRSLHRLPINNDWTALVARELVDRFEALKGKIEMRQRKAAA